MASRVTSSARVVDVDVDISKSKADLLLAGPVAQGFVTAVAKAAVAAAQDAAPVHTGFTRDSYVFVETDVEDGVPVARFGSKSPFWHIIEFGSVNNPAYRVMTRAMERLGLKLDFRRG